jgi:PRC-barrel domain protein
MVHDDPAHPHDIADPEHKLISSARVEGTPVFGEDGRKLGTIHSVMIDKVSGHVAFAVMAFGGFLHMGEYVRSIPWRQLTFDVARQGYVVDLTREQIGAGPKTRLADTERLVNRPTSSPFI